MIDPLNPSHRAVFTEGLRPPAGFVFDSAVATTFSVDLDALLLAPLALSVLGGDADSSDPGNPALLGALKNYADRIALYCDAMHVHVRSKPMDRRLLMLIEDQTLHPVSFRKGGAFHPKTWALRYRREDGAIRHRLLVLTRNHTFDRSWDLIVQLEEDEGASPVGAQVAGFLNELDRLSSSPVTRDLARSIRRAKFAPPEGFESAAFHYLGFGGPDPVKVKRGKRLCVVSPFLSSSRLQDLAGRITQRPERRVLISRRHALEEVGEAALAPFEDTFCLDFEADIAEDHHGGRSNASATDLHAKLYVLDSASGKSSTWFVGSANATHSSLHRNVETLIELTGRTSRVGVNELLKDAAVGELRLSSILYPFDPASGKQDEDPRAEDERRLEKLAKEVFDSKPQVECKGIKDGFALSLRFLKDPRGFQPRDALRVRLVTTTGRSGAGARKEQVRLGRRVCTTLAARRASLVTRLLEFTITSGAPTATRASEKVFIVPADLRGAPEDRFDQLIQDLITDEQSFRSFMYSILALDDSVASGSSNTRAHRAMAPGGPNGQSASLDIPLFEELARAYSRQPDRLDTVAEVVAALQETEEGRRRLPKGFEEMWETFNKARASK